MEITKEIREEMKAVKYLFDRASYFMSSERSELAEYYEKKAESAVLHICKKLSLPYNVVIDLIFDFNYTLDYLNQQNEKRN